MKQITIGSCIRSLRLQNNLTQTQLADQLGVTDKAVSKWERDLSYPDVVLFPKLVEVLGITLDDLLQGCNEEGRPMKLPQTCDLSRDIRTPLHIILGYVEIVKNNLDNPEMLEKYLEGIRISGEYMMSLLDRIQKKKKRSEKKTSGGEEYPVTQEELEEYLKDYGITGRKQQAYYFSGKRVLVTDDMAVNREIAAELLKKTGVETEFAEDGEICLRMVDEAPAGYYDLILMDLMMPNMDGLEATRRIRQLADPEKAAIPIVAMTTSVTEKDRSAALAAGMNAFTEKPVFLDKLFETMQQYLNHKD